MVLSCFSTFYVHTGLCHALSLKQHGKISMFLLSLMNKIIIIGSFYSKIRVLLLSPCFEKFHVERDLGYIGRER